MRNGYIEVWVDPTSPFRSMAGKDGYVYEHRLVMATSLGRPLTRDEEVHHRNKDKHDNRVSNLVVLDKAAHAFRHTDVDGLMRENALLRDEVRRLRESLREQAETP